MAAWWRSHRGRELVVGGLLLWFCVASILMLNRVLTAVSHRPRTVSKSVVGEVAKPPLYPAPKSLLDLSHFQYLTNADPCGGGDVTGVLLVTSHADHVELRSAHRRAYSRSELLRLGLRRAFLLAQPVRRGGAEGDADAWAARALRDEARRFSDIVQGDFKEAYRNLTYKHTMGLSWAAQYCPQARLVIKMDDDIVVDLYQLMDHMNRQPAADLASSMYGYVLHGLRPSREPANKWFVTSEEYAGDVYPDFLSGWVYVATPAAARALAEGAAEWTSRHHYFWIDDLLLTGMVREALAVPPHTPARPRLVLRDLRHVFTVNPEVIHCCLAEPDLRCDVLVGPNGGENELIVRFQAHAARCHYGTSCAARPPDRHVESTCVVRAAQADDRLPAEVARDGRGQASQVRMF